MFNGLRSFTEEIHAQLLELGTHQGLGEIIAILEGLNLELGAHLVRKSALRLLDFTLVLAESALVLQHVSTSHGLVCLGEVIHNAVVKVLPTKVRVTSGSQHLKHTNRQERNVESATTKVVHDDLRLATLLVKIVCDGWPRPLAR
jgi:hypothetical protein